MNILVEEAIKRVDLTDMYLQHYLYKSSFIPKEEQLFTPIIKRVERNMLKFLEIIKK